MAAHAEPVDALLRIRFRYRAFGEMVMHAGHCFEQRRRRLVQPALRLEERAMPMHRLVGEARLALRMVLEDCGRNDVGLVVVRLHPVVGIVDRTRRDVKFAVVDGDVEGRHVVLVAEVPRRVREHLADGCVLADERVSALGDPRLQVGPDRVHPVLREELQAGPRGGPAPWSAPAGVAGLLLPGGPVSAQPSDRTVFGQIGSARGAAGVIPITRPPENARHGDHRRSTESPKKPVVYKGARRPKASTLRIALGVTPSTAQSALA